MVILLAVQAAESAVVRDDPAGRGSNFFPRPSGFDLPSIKTGF